MKIGLTINNSYADLIKKIAHKNGLKPTTICSLIIETQLNYFEQNDVLPTFKQVTIMKYDPSNQKTINQYREEMKELKENIRLAQDHSCYKDD